ncbi:MAG: ABC transporter substrate-binding protein [Pseudomonadota bacterium]
MRKLVKAVSVTVVLLLTLSLPLAGAAWAFEPLAGDMTGFNPADQKFPEGDDVIKIGIFWPFSGPAAINGAIFWMTIGWSVYDVNSQGGIMVDGKMKKIVLIKGDHKMEPAAAKRAAEKLCLEDEVDLIFGTTGTHLNLIGQQVAAKYNKLYVNVAALSEMLMDGKNFNPYTFRAIPPTKVVSRALAYYYSARPEKKFYLLNPDYEYGHAFAQSFIEALKEFRPEAQIVGDDYHKLLLTDFAPFLTKIQGSGAEVIVTGSFLPDVGNLLKQKVQMGLDIPLAGNFFDDPNTLATIGGENGKGLVSVHEFMADARQPRQVKLVEMWNKQWRTYKDPLYGSPLFKWPGGILASSAINAYWFLDVLQRAGGVDPEKVIKTWEGDRWSFFGRELYMRPCDHQAVQDMFVSELYFPNNYHDNAAAVSTAPFVVPASFVQPSLPGDLDRCK